MKKSQFKMKGYSYPGTSPLKGKKKKARIAAYKQSGVDAQAKVTEALTTNMNEAFGPNEESATTDTTSPIEQNKEAYDPDEAYFQSLVKAVGETPELSDKDIRNPKKRDENDKLLHQKARQRQVIDYRNSQLKLEK